MNLIRDVLRSRRPDWDLAGPHRRSVPWERMRQRRNAGGRHPDTVRRLIAFGPWTVYVMRYRPGLVPEERERTP